MKERPAVNTSAAWIAAELHARLPRRRAGRPVPVHRLRGDRGEGVISVAIAILIIAFLGAAMWFGMQTMWTKTECKVENQVNQIGGGASGGKPAQPTGC